jgi:ketosteroid isomerase-like protein
MSVGEENVEVPVRAYFDNFARGDFDAVKAQFSGDAVVTVPGGGMLAGEYRGHAGFDRFLGILGRHVDPGASGFGVDDFSIGDRYVIVREVATLVRRDDPAREWELPLLLRFSVQDGRIAALNIVPEDAQTYDAFWAAGPPTPAHVSPALPDGSIPHDDWIAFHQVLARYAAGIDTKDWELFRTAFTDDCTLTYGEPWGPFADLDELVSFVAYFHAPLDGSQHSVTNLLVTELSDSHAVLRSAVDAVLVQEAHPDGPVFRVSGHYTDRLVRTAQGWRIESREFTAHLNEGNPNVAAWDWERPSVSAPTVAPSHR